MASNRARTAEVGEYLPFHIDTVTGATRTQLPITTTARYQAMDLGKGMFLGTVVLGDPGVSAVLTLFNGNVATNIIAVIKSTANVTLDFNCILEKGLWYTYTASTPGSITVNVLPMTV